jgi:hypothetical protein
MKINLLFLLIFLMPLKLFASNELCQDDMARLLQNYKGSEDIKNKFLALQAKLTMHKLAYALLRNTQTKNEFRLEKEILKILTDMEKEKKDREFLEVYQMYNDPQNKLSRSALSRVLPYIKDILNDQINEQSGFKRKYFNIGYADIKILAHLAKKESLSTNGVYDHRQFRSHNHDNSILNFVKIINSSIRNTIDSKENILSNLEKTIHSLIEKSHQLLKELGVPPECLQSKNACMLESGESLPFSVQGLDQFADILAKVENDDYMGLRYNDIWLHTKSHIQGTILGNQRNTKRKNFEKNVKVKVGHEREDYLRDHVLSYIPQLFTKEELEENMDFTSALAAAIDDGILTKKGDDRYFYVGDEKYVLPELWNDDYPDLGLKRPGKSLSTWFKRTFRFDPFSLDTIEVPKEIPSHLHRDFIETMNDQYKDFNHRYTFSFNGKLYTFPKGEVLGLGMTAFKKNFKRKSDANDEMRVVLNFDDPLVEKAVKEAIAMDQRSFEYENKIYHISGLKVNPKKEYERYKLNFNSINTNVSQSSFDNVRLPSFENLMKKGDNEDPFLIKALVDRKRVAYPKEGAPIDIVTLKRVKSAYASDIIYNFKLAQGNAVSLDEIDSKTPIFNTKRAIAVLENNPVFTFDNKRYSTISGKEVEVGKNPKIQRDLSSKMNSIKQHDALNKILAYYNQYPSDCRYISIVDKKLGFLSVYDYLKKPGVLEYQVPIEVGRVVGDERMLIRSLLSNETNNKTGAGIFKFLKKGNKIFLKHKFDDNGVIPMSLKGVEKPITHFTENFKTTNGDIHLPNDDYQFVLKNFIENDCPLYVMPETNKAMISLVNDELILKPILRTSLNTRNYYFDEKKKELPKTIDIVIADTRYINDQVNTFVESLEINKAQIMNDTGLSNNEYNELAKVAFGILGTESSFGEGETRLKFWNTYHFKESNFGQLLISAYKKELLIVPVGFNHFVPLPTNPNNNSRGSTQIKNVRGFLEKSYPEIKQENLNQPRNAAIATMYVLAEKYKHLELIKDQHQAITEENKMQYLYYMYLGSTKQITESSATPLLNPKVREANGYTKSVFIYTN